MNWSRRLRPLLMLAVLLGVMTARLGVMLLGLAGMAMGAVGVMRRLLVIAGLMVPGGFAVMPRGVFVVFGSLLMVLDACVLAHVALPVWRLRVRLIYTNPLTLC
jgi:hypothetical protein